MKTYGAMMTAWVASFTGFDAVWLYSEMDVFGCLFMGLLIGFIAAGAFLLVTDKISEVQEVFHRKTNRPEYTKDDQTGLQYMAMRNGKAVR